MKQIFWTLYRPDGTTYQSNGSPISDKIAQAWLEYSKTREQKEQMKHWLVETTK